MTKKFQLTMAQLNATVGGIAGNCDKVFRAWCAAKEANSDMVMLPEMFITGYQLQDLVMKPRFVQDTMSHISILAERCVDGPILDEYGNVVAVAVAKLSLKKILKDFGVVPENTNFGVKASAVRNLMEGNGVSFKSPNTEVISKRKLSRVATDGTVYLTCWMTTAQIQQMRAKKVLFEDLE